MAPRRSALDWVLEAFSFVTLLAIFGVILANWRNLPALVPEHFGISGNPNRWGNKKILLRLPLIATGLYLLLTVASRYPRLANLPMSIDREAPEVQPILLGMSITVKAVVLFIVLNIAWVADRAAMGRSEDIGMRFLPISIGAFLVTVSFYLIRLRRYRK